MSVEQNKAIVRAVLEESVRNPDIMQEHPGLHEIIPTITASQNAAPDMQVTITLMFAEGDWVAVRAVYSGTNTGSMMGMPPTGKHIEYECLMFHQVVDGKIVKQHSQIDGMGLMQQLGRSFPMGDAR